MPRYTAPNNPNCWIECSGGGYAFFSPPFGPCDVGCEDGNFGATFVHLPREEIENLTFSGVMHEFPIRTVGRFARQMLTREDVPGRAALLELGGLADEPAESVMSAKWHNEEFDGMLEVLLTATGTASLSI